ncbi:MAG: elongation factor G [Planctomycetota bacterium]
MATYSSADIRNLVFVGGGDSGKTSLTDALLFKTGVNSRLGRIEDGTSMSDFSEEEKRKQHSLSLSMLHLKYDGKLVHLLDAPGYPDFMGEAIAALHAVETAVFCINAYTGIVLNTRKLWEKARQLGRARALVVTKVDLENVDWENLIATIREVLGGECRPVFIPVGTGAALEAVVDCFDGLEAAPAKTKTEASRVREQLVEALVETDEAVMERYLEGGEISADELRTLMTRSLVEGRLAPILCCSVNADKGVEEVLKYACRYFPSPLDGPFFKGLLEGKEVVVNPAQTKEFSGFVFKTVTDPFVQKASYVRVVSGELKTDSSVANRRTEKNEKVAHLLKPQGKELVPVSIAVAGEIVAIPKAETLQFADTLAAGACAITYPRPAMPAPMVGRAVEPKSRNDEQKIGVALRRLAEEDPTFELVRDAQTSEMIVHGLSNLHLDVMFDRLKDRFKVEVITKPPKIPYRETATVTATAMYRHKKQTGGAGQFAEVHLRVEPRERSSGYEFASEVFGGAISGPFVQSVDKGIQQVLPRGVIAGYPVVDVKVVVYDGKEHPVDSKDIAFQVAGRQAFKAAFKNAKPVLLEPLVRLEVTVPAQYMGDISGDMNSRRGRILGMDSVGNEQVIKAIVPLAEVQTYSQDLRSITAGEGSFSMELSHYDPVPPRVAEAIIAKFEAKEEED